VTEGKKPFEKQMRKVAASAVTGGAYLLAKGSLTLNLKQTDPMTSAPVQSL
jgi:hypothetical protein